MFNLGLPTTLAPAPNPVIQGMQNMALLQQQQQKAALAQQMMRYSPQFAAASLQQAQANPLETLAKAYNQRMGGALQGAQLSSLPAQQQAEAAVGQAKATQLIPAEAKMQIAQAGLQQQLAQTQQSVRAKNIADAILAKATAGYQSTQSQQLGNTQGGLDAAGNPQSNDGGQSGPPTTSPTTNKPYPVNTPFNSWDPATRSDYYENSNLPPPLPTGTPVIKNSDVPAPTAQKIVALPQAARAYLQMNSDLNNPGFSKYFGRTAPAIANRLAAEAIVARGGTPPPGYVAYQSFISEITTNGEEIARASTGTNNGDLILKFSSAYGDPNKLTVPQMKGILEKLGRNMYENSENYVGQNFQTNYRMPAYQAAQMLHNAGFGGSEDTPTGGSGTPVANPGQMRSLNQQLKGLVAGQNGQVQQKGAVTNLYM